MENKKYENSVFKKIFNDKENYIMRCLSHHMELKIN